MDDTVLMGRAGGPLAWVVVASGPDESRFFKLTQENHLGREADCSIHLNDSKVSGYHACIRYEHGQFVIHDLASRNRTYVNKQVVGAPQGLSDGDTIYVGDSELIFKRAR